MKQEEKKEIRIYVTRVPIFAEGQTRSHVLGKIEESPFDGMVAVKTGCGRRFDYTPLGFDGMQNVFVLVSNRGLKILFHSEADRYTRNAGKCMTCGVDGTRDMFHSHFTKRPREWFEKRPTVTNTTVHCIADSELDRFVATIPLDRYA